MALHGRAAGVVMSADLESGSLHDALRAGGLVPARGRATIDAETAGEEDARLLGIAPGSALLVERRLILDLRGRPLESTESRYPGDRLRARRGLRGRGLPRRGPAATCRLRRRQAWTDGPGSWRHSTHREADRVPRDLGAVRMTGIHVRAYAALRGELGLDDGAVRVGDLSQQLAVVDVDVADRLGIDVRGVEPRESVGVPPRDRRRG